MSLKRRVQAARASDLRTLVPSTARSAQARAAWPAPLHVTPAARRTVIRKLAGEVCLSEPGLVEAVAQEAGPEWASDGAILRNPTLNQAWKQRAYQQAETMHQVAAAFAYPDIPDSLVMGTLRSDSVNGTWLPQVERLAAQRPALLHAREDLPVKTRAVLLGSVHAHPGDLDAVLSLPALSAARKFGLACAAASPALDPDTRSQAIAQLAKGHAGLTRQLQVRAAQVPHLTWPWTAADIPVSMISGLHAWAAGQLGISSFSNPWNDQVERPEALRMLKGHPDTASLPIVAPSQARAWHPYDAQRLPSCPTWSKARGAERVVSAAMCALPAEVLTWEGRSSWSPRTACAIACRVELGSSVAAWEALIGLAPEWEGTLGDLIRTSRSL